MQGRGQGQGPSLQGPGQGQELDLPVQGQGTSLTLTSCLPASFGDERSPNVEVIRRCTETLGVYIYDNMPPHGCLHRARINETPPRGCIIQSGCVRVKPRFYRSRGLKRGGLSWPQLRPTCQPRWSGSAGAWPTWCLYRRQTDSQTRFELCVIYTGNFAVLQPPPFHAYTQAPADTQRINCRTSIKGTQ